MRRTGCDKVCQKYDVLFYDLRKDAVRTVKTAVGNCCMDVFTRAKTE